MWPGAEKWKTSLCVCPYHDINGFFIFATKRSHVCCQSVFSKKKIASNIVYRVRESIFDRNMNKWWGEPQKGIVSRNQAVAFVFELLEGQNTLKDWENDVVQKTDMKDFLTGGNWQWWRVSLRTAITTNANKKQAKEFGEKANKKFWISQLLRFSSHDGTVSPEHIHRPRDTQPK